MTTYDGKSASFNPAIQCPNKEPPVSKFVVEKLYRVHRSRIMNIEPVVDCQVVIPDFLTNQDWKKNAEKHRLQVIKSENEDMFRRLEKVENNESSYTKDSRVHIKRINGKLKYIRHLKESNRVRKLIMIQRENEEMMRRMEKARPQYSMKACREWYHHHEMFKSGR